MVFVPAPFVPPPEATPQARDLANRITQVIQQFRQQYPALTERDIREAVRLATGRSGGQSALRQRAVVLGALAAAAGGLMVYLTRNNGQGLPSFGVLAIVVAVAIAAIAARASR